MSKPVGLNNGYIVNKSTLNLVGNITITLQYKNGDIFLTFLSIYNFESYGLIADDWSQQAISDIRLKSITVYPVKSCQGFSVQSWPLTTGGMHNFGTFSSSVFWG